MNQKNIELAKDPDLAGPWVAIRPAAKRAAQVAVSTNTELVVQRNGKRATGVGKTRLMCAFISYMHLAHSRHNCSTASDAILPG